MDDDPSSYLGMTTACAECGLEIFMTEELRWIDTTTGKGLCKPDEPSRGMPRLHAPQRWRAATDVTGD